MNYGRNNHKGAADITGMKPMEFFLHASCRALLLTDKIMTQEDKQLLLKDLCARLPYGVKCDCKHDHAITPTRVDTEDLTVYYADCDEWEYVEYCKPYLRPMSSMTEEEKFEYGFITERWMYDATYSISDSVDWLNAHHFDYRGLIEKGLAIEVTEENNPY